MDYHVTKKDIEKAPDQFCATCKAKKEKYLGKILGTPAVMFRNTCHCDEVNFGKTGKSDKTRFDELQIPFWKLMGQKPKPKDIALERYLKHRNMSYGDWRRERDYRYAKNPSGLSDWQKHFNKYGKNNEPTPQYQRGEETR